MHLTLDTNWEMKCRDAELSLADDFALAHGWLPAQVPGTVHQDLLAAGVIADPFMGRNEVDVEWVAERDWLYRCHMVFPTLDALPACVDLLCDGLDTFATVWFNDQKILESDNMFRAFRIPIRELLRPGVNEVRVAFASALRVGRAIDAQRPPLIAQSWSGERNRFYVRKAQYQYGWDWGPTLVTAGIWQPMSIEAYDVTLTSLDCVPFVEEALDKARLPVTVTLEGEVTDRDRISIELLSPSGALLDAITCAAAPHLTQEFHVMAPELWWPIGHGAQPLYRLTAILYRGDQLLAERSLRVGVRQVRLMQPSLGTGQGSAFWFEVNHTPIFCGGANWIPADFFTGRVTPERYYTWVRLAAEAHMTMLRVWGGGIYEAEAFYDACDEHGILVWQDFMFACGMYPADDAFLANVRAEAEAVVTRLRHHPCLALWCGNNEDYMVAGSIGAYDPADGGDFRTSAFPARTIYERLLPDICAALDPDRPYWPGSPYGGADGNAGTVGDQHIWTVWHHQMAPYQEYGTFPSRFVSEFGMQALPARATIEAFTTPEERYPQSLTLEFHNKGERGVRRLTTYLADNVRIPQDLDAYIYASQLVQAEAVAAGLRGWRRQWNAQRIVGGALVWQLDDCWPGTSWALVDYYLRPKPAYYAVRRALAPLVVELAHHRPGYIAVWAVNDAATPLVGEVQLDSWAADGTHLGSHCLPIALMAQGASELGTFPFHEHALMTSAVLVQGGQPRARAYLWSEPLKYVTFHDPHLVVERTGEYLTLLAHTPVKGLWLAAGDDVAWNDNLLDLVPGVSVTIHAQGLGDREVTMRSLT